MHQPRLSRQPAQLFFLHEPQLWPEYGPRYYAVFVRDPAGHDLELTCRSSTAQPAHPYTTEEPAS